MLKGTLNWYLILMGALILTLSGCFQSAPESPQDAVEEKVSERVLTLVPAQPTPFEGTTWDLKFIYNGKEWQPVIPGTTVTAQFQGDQMSGSAGCNNYNATVTIEGETLTISGVASTRKACAEPEGVMDQETMVLSMLQSVTGYRAAGYALALLDADGQAILVFGAQ